jgi:hypothetical protein
LLVACALDPVAGQDAVVVQLLVELEGHARTIGAGAAAFVGVDGIETVAVAVDVACAATELAGTDTPPSRTVCSWLPPVPKPYQK